MSIHLRNHLLAASTIVVTPVTEWEGILSELRAFVHPADWWVPAELEKPITIAEVRAMLYFAHQTPVGEMKIAVIPAVDSLRPEAANALLKILEEPPAYLYLVLLAQSAVILPTVRSRARLLRLSAAATGEASDLEQWQGLLAEYEREGAAAEKDLQDLLYLTPLLHSTIQQGVVREAFSPHNKQQ